MPSCFHKFTNPSFWKSRACPFGQVTMIAKKRRARLAGFQNLPLPNLFVKGAKIAIGWVSGWVTKYTYMIAKILTINWFDAKYMYHTRGHWHEQPKCG